MTRGMSLRKPSRTPALPNQCGSKVANRGDLATRSAFVTRFDLAHQLDSLEARGGIEPPYADLQSAASPLCHRAVREAAAAPIHPKNWPQKLAPKAEPRRPAPKAGPEGRIVAALIDRG